MANVMGSRGSVIPFFIGKRDSGAKELPITDMRMTRFNISLQAGVDLVMYAIGHHLGGEIFVPKIPFIPYYGRSHGNRPDPASGGSGESVRARNCMKK